MQNFMTRVFRLQPDEVKTVLIMGLLLLANSMSRQMSGIVGISDFLDEGGINQILYVMAIDGVNLIFTAAIASLIVDRFNRVSLLRWTALVFALAFIILRLIAMIDLPEGLAGLDAALLYLLSQQQWLIFPMFFWVLANDMFEIAQTKRVFPLISTWSFVGKMLGIGVAFIPALLVGLGLTRQNDLTLEAVVTTNAVIYFLAALIISLALRDVKIRETVQRGETLTETLTEGWGFVKEVPSYRFLIVSIMSLIIVDMVVDFRFFVISKTNIADPAFYKQFYAGYRLVAAVVSILFQSLLTSRIIQKIDLKNTFLIQPVVAFLSTAAMLISAGLATGFGASVLLKISRNTVDESARKTFLGLVPEERRGRVSLFIENYVPAVGIILGAAIPAAVIAIGQATHFEPVNLIYLGITLGFAALSIWAIYRMRLVYDSSLLNWRLKRRTRRSSVLDKLDF